MKLDINCVRDVLLCLEETLVLDEDLSCNGFSIETLYDQCNLEQYTIAEVGYTLVKLEEAGYINASFQWLNRQIYFSDISSITFAGHQFLDTIRPPSIWAKICDISKKTGAKSFSAVIKIAEICLPELISYTLNN